MQDKDNPDSQDPTATADPTLGKVVVSILVLIPFEQKKGEEVPDFSTIFYDREKKRIVKRTEKKVETGGQSGRMINDKNVVHGIDKDRRLTIRDGVALIHASKDNVDRIMTDLEQSRKNVAQLKDTLRKERDESSRLKRKFEDMRNEVKTSEAELQSLQADKMSLEVIIEKTGRDAQDSLAKEQ